MSYKTPWRSLGDSNPCFRRERDAKPSIAIHSRRRSVRKYFNLRPFPCALVLTCLSTYIGPILDPKPPDLTHGSRRAAQSS